MTQPNKTAVITGGSRGIGAETAEVLARAGYEVVLTYRSRRRAAQAVAERIARAGGRAEARRLEVTSPAQVRAFGARLRRRHDRVDLLFNNAGDMLGRVPLEQQTPLHIRRVLDLNVSSVILVTQAVLPLLGRGSVIVNMSSAAGRDGGGPGAATYAAAKAAVLGLTRGWAKELAPRGIRVFAVAPGVIATDFHLRNSKPEQLAQFARDCPLGKLGQVNDVARAVLYLAGEGAGFMTGVTVDLNGGRTMA